jgi:single-strand DNA-binding protein
MLRIALIGHLGADPGVRYSPKGVAIVEFRVATNQVRTGLDGERQASTEWFRIRVMGRQAEYAQRLTKGTRVSVAGRLDISHYQSREGEPRVGFDVWADEVQNLSPRPSDERGSDTEGGNPPAPGRSDRRSTTGPGPSPGGAGAEPAEDELEDLPF